MSAHRSPSPTSVAAAAVIAAAAAVAWVAWLREGMLGIDGSTEAWILAHVQRVHWLGDYALAASESAVPNTTVNPLFPLLVTLASHDVPTAMMAAHAIAAGSLGLLAVGLWGLWRGIVGPGAALAAAGGGLLPAAVATAAQARYDSLAVALAVLTAWAAAAALQRGPAGRGLPWALAGTLAALAYLAREYVGLMAIGALGVAAVASVVRHRRLHGPLVALVQAALVTCALTLPLGLDPLGGVRAVVAFTGQDVPPMAVQPELIGAPLRRVLLALGGLGFVVAAVRRRLGPGGALLVPASLLLPYALMQLLPPQSPQYYVLAFAILGSGLAGLVDALPAAVPARARAGLSALLLLLVAAASHRMVPPALAAGPRATARVHVETSGLDIAGLRDLLDQAAAEAGPRQLVLSSQVIENLDAYAQLHLGRPVAFTFPGRDDALGGILPSLRGEPVVLVRIEQHAADVRPPDLDATLLAEWSSSDLVARAWRIEGRPLGNSPDLCEGPFVLRGFCAQRDWRWGGLAGWRQQAAHRRAAHGALVQAYGGPEVSPDRAPGGAAEGRR